ncbi:MAG: type III pantothenate kinase [Pirellulales bacterium]
MSRALWAVDIGNTAMKVGRFDDTPPRRGELPEPRQTWERPTLEGFQSPPDHWPDDDAPWFVTSVNRPVYDAFLQWRATRGLQSECRKLTQGDIPLTLAVDSPERVGLDRLATAVAADWLRHPDRPAIVVDAGTALKVHLVTVDRAFAGGAILPGFRLAYESLHAKTDLLPRVAVSTNEPPPEVLGRNTESAIRSGIYWGAVGAVRELITRIRHELHSDPQVFITGGDAAGLAPLIDHDTQFVPHLCLAGVALVVFHHGWLHDSTA